MKNVNKYLLVDINSIFHRSYNCLIKRMPNSVDANGNPCVGTYGFFNSLFKVFKEVGGFDGILFARDVKGSTSARKKIDPNYKSGRKTKEQHFYDDFDNLIENHLPTLGITPIGYDGYEADDIIASCCNFIGSEPTVYIFSGDGDLEQCAKYSSNIYWVKTQPKWKIISYDDVITKWGGVDPKYITTLKSITGDSSDSIGGVKGYKLAKALKVYKDASWLSQHRHIVESNKLLISFIDDLPITPQPANITEESLTKLFTDLNSNTLLKRLPKILNSISLSKGV